MTDRRRGVRYVETATEDLPRPFREPTRDTGPDDAGGDADAEPQIDPLQEAYERGRAEGAAEIRDAAGTQLDTELGRLRDELSRSLAELAVVEDQIRRDSTKLMTELALEAASCIVRQRIEDNDPIASRALEAAVAALPDTTTIEVRIHPDDEPTIRTSLTELIERRGIELIADEQIGRGGCLAVSPAGTIDARIETASRAVRDAAFGTPELA